MWYKNSSDSLEKEVCPINFDKNTKEIQRGKGNISINHAEKTGCPYGKENHLWIPSHAIKTNSKGIIDLNVKGKNYKTSGRKHKRICLRTWVGRDLLYRAQKVPAIK